MVSTLEHPAATVLGLDRRRGSDGVTRGSSGTRPFCRRRESLRARPLGLGEIGRTMDRLGGRFIKQDFSFHRFRSITISNILLTIVYSPL